MSKKEETKLKDQIKLSIKTPFVLSEVPSSTPPDSLIFDIRKYRGREWTLLFMDKSFYQEIEELCKKRGLNAREVLYGTLLKLKTLLKK